VYLGLVEVFTIQYCIWEAQTLIIYPSLHICSLFPQATMGDGDYLTAFSQVLMPVA